MSADGEKDAGTAPAVTGFRKILRNSATLISARIISKIAMTLFMITLARRLGTVDFGVFSSVVAFIAFFSMIEEFGLNAPTIRRIARAPAEGPRILGEVIGLKVVLGTAAYFLLVAASVASGLSPVVSAILGLSMIFEILAQTVTRAFEAYERMRFVAIITIVERSLLCITGVAAVLFTGSLAVVAGAYLTTFAASLALAAFLFGRNIGPLRPAFSRPTWAPMMREALPFFLAGILSTIWNRVDIYLLTTFRTPAEVGSYNAALRVVEAQIFIPVAILGSVFPVLSRLQGVSTIEFDRMFGKNFLLLFTMGLTISAVTYFYSGLIISILFGEQYGESAAILRVIAPMIFFSFLHYLTSGALVAMRRELLTTLTLGLGAAISVILGFIYIPAGGSRASGVIKVVAEAVTFGVQGILLGILMLRARRRRKQPRAGSG